MTARASAAEWEHVGSASAYSVWRKDSCGENVFNVTYGEPPVHSAGGYFVLATLLALKGLTMDDYVELPGRAGP